VLIDDGILVSGASEVVARSVSSFSDISERSLRI
jgi:hypothetical protein